MISLENTETHAILMVSQPRGHHVLPHQEVRNSLLPPDRREPLGGRATTPTGHRHTRATRPTPADRTTRRPAGSRAPASPSPSPSPRPPPGGTPPPPPPAASDRP